ncbi:unnamed protein product, partial [Ectocarpus fasciculatus]
MIPRQTSLLHSMALLVGTVVTLLSCCTGKAPPSIHQTAHTTSKRD